MPTEAEWEYACRAGTQARYYWGEDQIDEFAWYIANSDSKTHEVGQKNPNAWGLYDMSGNVSEWCQDWFGSYDGSPQINPTGADSGWGRIQRGGGLLADLKHCRSAFRDFFKPSGLNASVGFRLVLSQSGVLRPTPTATPDVTATATPDVTATATQTPIEETITIPLTGLPEGTTQMEMVYIPAGLFMMGSPSDEKDRHHSEGPQHPVMIANGFYMGKYEVTQAQWQAVMGSNPSKDYGVGANHPVNSVSWNDCQTFIEKLNQRGEGTFRLPTEAEWEYACRAGTVTRYYWGDDPDDDQIIDYAWYTGNNSSGGSKEVGSKRPNAWGLYDMGGNLEEWYQDWFGSYSSSAQMDPMGPLSGSHRVLRGGFWHGNAQYCRSAGRAGSSPGNHRYYFGFRLALSRTE